MDLATLPLAGLTSTLGPFALRLAGALAIAAGAWLGARLVRAALLRLTAKVGLDERVHHPGLGAVLADMGQWLVWLLALPAILGALQLQGLLDPVNAMLSRLLGYLPNLMGAAVVLGIGVLMAGIARRIVTGLLTAAGSERVAERLGLRTALGERTLAGIVGSIVFALMLLPTLASALQALGLDAVTKPVSQLLESITAMIPRLVSAAIVLGVGALIGRALASAASGVLAGLGANTWPQRMGLPADTPAGGRQASDWGGLLVMAAVMFVALAQACQVIGFGLLTEAVATLGGVLARVVVAALVLGLGLWLGTVVAQLVRASGVAHGALLGQLARAAVLFFAGALALRQAGLPAEIVAIAFGSVLGALALGAALALGLGGQRVAARLLDQAARAFENQGPTDDGTPKA